MVFSLSYTEYDRMIWETELSDFVPDKVFDAHAHLWSEKNANASTAASVLRYEADAGTLFRWGNTVFPGRQLAFMMLGSPVRGVDFESDREWCVKESLRCPGCVCGVLLPPWMEPEKLISEYRRLHFKAVKPYFSFAGHAAESPLHELIPEQLVEAADQCSLAVVLHIAKPECFSDSENLRTLGYFTRKYPRVTWQLAHCARSFNSILLEKPLRRLKGLEHICYDLSAVCDDYSMYLLFRHENRSRLMFGTDAVVNGGMRGTYAAFGRSWGLAGTDRNDATLVCYEQIRAMRRAADMAGLSQDELNAIFYDNAVEIYRKDKE